MTKLGIIGAMQQEVENLLGVLENKSARVRAGSTFYEGNLEGLSVVIVQCGVGKVNAALCAQILCDCYGVTHLVNTGIAGSLCAELDIGDLVVSRDAMYHDFDCVHFGYPYGKVPGMDVIAFNRSRRPEGALIADYVELDELLRRSDVSSLHCPLFPETREIINKNTIAKMKDGVIIINNSRGALVAEQDLADALNSGKVYAAGLDVVSSEPISEDNPLLHAKNCIITPHISWASMESRRRIIESTAGNIRAWLAGNPRNVVNK